MSPSDLAVLDVAGLVDRLAAIDGSSRRSSAFVAHRTVAAWPWLIAQVSPGPSAPRWHVSVAASSGVVTCTDRAIHRELVALQLAESGVFGAAPFMEVIGWESDANPYSPDGQRQRRRDVDTRTVYFIQAASRSGPIKIGVAVSPADRLAKIQRMSPVLLDIIAEIRGGGQPEEARLHARFASHRLHGEWFSPAPELLAYIEEFA